MKFASKFIISTILLLGFFLSPLSVSLQESAPVLGTLNSEMQYQARLSLDITQAHAQVQYDSCKPSEVFCGTKNAIVSFFELIWYKTTQVLAALAGFVLDFFLSVSIDSQSYRSGIIEAGWEILRDFTNIIFIFALLLIAFNLVLGNDKVDVKKLLVKTILVALVINFSLFVTYAIVDASNILSHALYNKIEVVGKAGITEGSNSSIDRFLQESETKSVSLAVVSQFNPQRIITYAGRAEFFESVLIVFIAGALNILLIYIFISIAMLFLARTVGIILLGIFAPIAFATLTLPRATEISWVGFNKWWKQLLTLAFSAPIFIFLMYLTIMFASNTGIMASMQSANSGDNLFLNILNVLLPFALIAILLMTSLKATKKLAGEIGTIVVDTVKKAAGGAITAGAVLATGGIAVAGGAARFSGRLLSDGSKGLGGEGKVGKSISNFGRGLQSQNFNFGSNKYIKKLGNLAGVDTTMGIGDKSLSYRDRVSKPIREFAATPSLRSAREGSAMWDIENKKIKETANWQTKVREETAKADIENKKENFMEEINPRTGQTHKKDLEDALTNFSKGQVPRESAPGVPENVTYNIGGGPVTYSMVDSTGAGVSRIDFEHAQIKTMEKTEKTLQNNLANARASGVGIAAAQAALDAQQDAMKEFKDQTLKAMKEEAQKNEQKIISRAGEKIAEERERKGETKTAGKIRSGKIKIEETKLEDI